MIFSIMFYTNGAFRIDKAGINIDNLNGFTIPLLLLVICLEFSKIGMVLYRPFLKNQRMFHLSHRLLSILLFMSIMASVSFTMLTDSNLNIGLKFVNMIDVYIPLLIFKKHFVLLVNCSLCIMVEIFIIQLPQFIINLFIDKDLVNESNGYVSRILKIFNNLINYKITHLEEKFNKYTNPSNIITKKSIPNYENIQIIQENNIDETHQLNENTKVLESPKSTFRLINCDAINKTQQPNIISNVEKVRATNSIDIKTENKSPYTSDNLNIADNVKDDFTNDELLEYLTYIYDNKNENISPGQSKISENTDLSYKKIKAIRYYLENKNIIKIDDKLTYLTMDTLDEVMKSLELEAIENE